MIDFQRIIEESQKETEGKDFKEDAIIAQGGFNQIAWGDNLAYMKYLLEEKGMAGRVNMIYIDPPFSSNSKYDAVLKLENGQSIKHACYDDKLSLEDYLLMMAKRLYLMKGLLADDGTIWVHLDWHASHYVKVLMDEIFQEKNFVNEIVWMYKSGGSGKKHFSRKHDTILVYSKGKKYYFNPGKEKSYNRGFKPYRFKGVKEYKDELGWYTMVNMKDVWQIDMVGRTSKERTGYATQKPEALLERIIEASTREGDIVCDFFAGSGTLGAVAERLNRRWLLCDNSALAVQSQAKRLSDQKASFTMVCMEDLKRDKKKAKIKHSFEKIEMTDKYHLILDLLKQDMEVSYWSIDFDYDGEIHRPALILSGKESRCEKLLAKPQIIDIRVVDIFGNVSSLQVPLA